MNFDQPGTEIGNSGKKKRGGRQAGSAGGKASTGEVENNSARRDLPEKP